jgi:hypothetical protein
VKCHSEKEMENAKSHGYEKWQTGNSGSLSKLPGQDAQNWESLTNSNYFNNQKY